MKRIKKYIIENFSNFIFFYSILRYRLIIVFALAILGGILDSIGLTMFLPLLQMADGGTSTDMGNLSFITNGLSAIGIQLTLLKALVILVFVFLLKGIVMYYSGIYRLLTQQILTKKIRMNIINEFPYYPYSEYIKTDLGQIQNIFIGEMNRLLNTYTNYTAMIQGAIMIVIYMVFTFIVDWKFAFLVVIGGIVSNLIFAKINKLTKQRSENISEVNNIFAGTLLQYITHFKYLRATGKILDYRGKVESSIDEIQNEVLHVNLLTNKVSAFREPLLIVIVAIVIGIQVYFIDSPISAIIVSLLFFYRALVGVVSVQSNFNLTVSNQGAINNIMNFYGRMLTFHEQSGTKEILDFKNRIELKNVVFAYNEQIILRNINLILPKNQCIALVGESGSGKTTLANILINLLKPTTGEITIDDIPYKELKSYSLQQRIGYITQEPTIFNDTIYNNVSFWAEKTPENLKKFNDVMKKSLLTTLVESLADKEDSVLGNNGINLSGGQRQRISIARELFKEVDILVLDEATSALDSQSEQQIQYNIERLHGNVTLIIIAHRLSTIKNADVIYLIEKGEIIESGSFLELKNKSLTFSRMVELQGLTTK